ncbi:MAG: TAXI family TRAP transporter solute-binding subunit [Gammaproteobacteria bacterium]|nr:TAXI family TRAP transporter solute-binding subunit [Gammaproteobacteria bacterium]
MDRIKTFGGAAVLVALALWFTYQFVEPAPPRSLSIATGSPEGAYYQYALKMQQAFAEEGIELQIIETAGSVANLLELKKGADVAFLQSGIGDAQRDGRIEGLASVYFEPLWLFSNTASRLTRISELKGLRLAVGGVGSGTRKVATQLLQQNDLADDQVVLVPLSGNAAAEALIANEIDAAMTISSSDATLVQQLIRREDIHLMSFSRATAYARRYPHFSHLTLPEGIVDLPLNIPSEDISLLANAATLVASEDLHPALSDLLLQITDELFQQNTLFSNTDRFPSNDFLDFPTSAEAARYFKRGVPILQRYLPFWAANLIDRMKLLALPLIALFLPLSRILPPAYRWTVRKKVYKWYDEVQIIDQEAHNSASASELRVCLDRLHQIEELARDVEVPLGFAHELYGLRHHIDMLSLQIERRLPITAIAKE